MNPWFSIWLKPRVTIRHVLAGDPERHILVLAGLAGIGYALDRADMRAAGDSLELLFIALGALMLGPLLGVLGLYLGGALLGWSGRWLGGKASAVTLRAAIGWACAIKAWGLLLWLPQVAVFGREVFTRDMPSLSEVPALIWVALAFALASVVLELWQLTVLIIGIAEVQGFTLWRAAASLLLSFALMVAVVLIVALPLRLFG